MMYMFKENTGVYIKQVVACEVIGITQPTLSDILNRKVACRKVTAFSITKYIDKDAEIEDYLPKLQKRLEELFMRQVGLPLKYDFVYKKVFCDALSLQLEIIAFLRKKYGAMSKQTSENNVTVSLDGHTWLVKMNLPANLFDFLTNSLQWKKFQQDLRDRNFYDFDFQLQAI